MPVRSAFFAQKGSDYYLLFLDYLFQYNVETNISTTYPLDVLGIDDARLITFNE